jgi:lipopolysaccharide biosynthesis regulator YciM
LATAAGGETAAHCLEQAATRTDEPAVRAELLLGLADVHSATGNLEDALAAWRSVLAGSRAVAGNTPSGWLQRGAALFCRLDGGMTLWQLAEALDDIDN